MELVPLDEWALVFSNAAPYSAVLENTHCVTVYSCRSEVQNIRRRTCSRSLSPSELLFLPRRSIVQIVAMRSRAQTHNTAQSLGTLVNRIAARYLRTVCPVFQGD